MNGSRDERRVVIYCRQSITRGEVDDSLSLESQERACREYVARQGWQLVGVYVDPDTRGWRTDRPEFMKMLDLFRAGGADVACVYKLSRFARNLVHQETVLTEIAAAGGDLVSVTEPYLNTSPMVRQILGAVNEQHKRDASDFLKASFASRARRGKHHGYAPYGYRGGEDGVLEEDGATADTVRQMFAWALDGHGSPEITYRLNERGHTTRNGKPWQQATVLRALRNPVYAGDIVFGGEVVARDAHPALVSRDMYERVQDVLQRRQRVRRKASPSWADGFVYHSCGARMHVAKWSAGDDHRWRFRCGVHYRARKDRAEPTCALPRTSVFQDVAERAFVALLIDALSTVATPAQARARIEAHHDATVKEREAQRKRLTKRLDDLQRQRDRLLDMTLAGRVDDEMYVMRDATLKADIGDVRAELDAVPAEVPERALEAHYAALMDIADAVPIVAHSAPERLPGLLHELDVRLVVSEEGFRLAWGEMTAAFVG